VKIHGPELTWRGDRAVASCRLEGLRCEPTLLWFSVPAAYAGALTPVRADGFVVATLVAAMATGGTVEVEAPLSERLYYNLTSSAIPVLRTLLPDLRDVRIEPSALDNRQFSDAAGVATGFSGGVDSFTVLADHLLDPGRTLPNYRVTHLLFNNVGSHRSGADTDRVFRLRFGRLAPAAAELGLPVIVVDYKFDELQDYN
jgi:hypothetical protein